MFDYRDFTSRNWIFIEDNLQQSIKSARILFLGCGLGSSIAELAVRLGFENITLIDGDKVDISNLNRQSFTSKDIGISKVVALKDKLLSINPEVSIKIVDSFIDDLEKIKLEIKENDFIINSFDVSSLYFELIKFSSENNKYVLLPFNVGFGGLVLAISPEKKMLNKFLKDFDKSDSDLNFLLKLSKKGKGLKKPGYILRNIPKIVKETKGRGYNSQIGIGSFITSSVVINLIIKVLSKEKVLLYPRVNHLDIYKQK